MYHGLLIEVTSYVKAKSNYNIYYQCSSKNRKVSKV